MIRKFFIVVSVVVCLTSLWFAFYHNFEIAYLYLTVGLVAHLLSEV